MTKTIKLVLSLAVFGFTAACDSSPKEPDLARQVDEQMTGGDRPQPNILLIVIDDLGYTDLGAYGSEIETPNIDRLAATGLVFSNAHSYPSCAPTRAALMTGLDPHQVGLGSQNGVAPPGVSTEVLGYGGSLEGDFVGIAERLSEQGYNTYQTGKWHLGFGADQSPSAIGFDKHFTLIGGVASHYGDALGRSLSSDPPNGLAVYRENGEIVEDLPEDYYSTEYFTSKLMEYIEEGFNESPDTPFFGYLAYTALHDPLHAPQDVVERYLDVFSEGFEALRATRIKGLAQAGLIANADIETRWPSVTPDWVTLSGAQQSEMVRRLATHAAMLDYLDTQLGRLFDLLEDRDAFSNTLIIVASDNGGSPLPRTAYLRTPEDREWQYSVYPNAQVSDYGKPGTFPTLGMSNAQAIAGPYFSFKTNVHEGGTRIPMIAKLPNAETSRQVDDFVHLVDLYPTFLDYMGSEQPTKGLAGCTLRTLFESETGQRCSDEFGMAYLGQRAFRSGDWKLVFAPESFGGTGRYALYDLSNDPGETLDLSSSHPEVVEELAEKWLLYSAERNVQIADMDAVAAFYENLAPRFYQLNWGQNDQVGD